VPAGDLPTALPPTDLAPSGTGRLRTPSRGAGIPDSITRRKVIETLGDVEEGGYQLDELLGATEAFLASSVREVQPVSSIDGVELDRHGARTQEARAAFDGTIADWRGNQS